MLFEEAVSFTFRTSIVLSCFQSASNCALHESVVCFRHDIAVTHMHASVRVSVHSLLDKQGVLKRTCAVFAADP
jgi:hypothetical protein